MHNWIRQCDNSLGVSLCMSMSFCNYRDTCLALRFQVWTKVGVIHIPELLLNNFLYLLKIGLYWEIVLCINHVYNYMTFIWRTSELIGDNSKVIVVSEYLLWPYELLKLTRVYTGREGRQSNGGTCRPKQRMGLSGSFVAQRSNCSGVHKLWCYICGICYKEREGPESWNSVVARLNIWGISRTACACTVKREGLF